MRIGCERGDESWKELEGGHPRRMDAVQGRSRPRVPESATKSTECRRMKPFVGGKEKQRTGVNDVP